MADFAGGIVVSQSAGIELKVFCCLSQTRARARHSVLGKSFRLVKAVVPFLRALQGAKARWSRRWYQRCYEPYRSPNNRLPAAERKTRPQVPCNRAPESQSRTPRGMVSRRRIGRIACKARVPKLSVESLLCRRGGKPEAAIRSITVPTAFQAVALVAFQFMVNDSKSRAAVSYRTGFAGLAAGER